MTIPIYLRTIFKTHQAPWFLLFLRTTHLSCMEAAVCCRRWKAGEKEGKKYTPYTGEEYIFPPLSSSPSWPERRDLRWIQYPSTRERGRTGSGTEELEWVGLVWLSWGYHPGAQTAQCYPCLVMLVHSEFHYLHRAIQHTPVWRWTCSFFRSSLQNQTPAFFICSNINFWQTFILVNGEEIGKLGGKMNLDKSIKLLNGWGLA